MGNSWAVDLANVGAVYPWLGYEVIMVVIAVVAWLIWHFAQIREEENEFAEDIKLHGSKEKIQKALDERV
jgi:hypothetical protein